MATPKRKVIIDPDNQEKFFFSEAEVLEYASDGWIDIEDGEFIELEVYEFAGKKKLRKQSRFVIE